MNLKSITYNNVDCNVAKKISEPTSANRISCSCLSPKVTLLAKKCRFKKKKN